MRAGANGLGLRLMRAEAPSTPTAGAAYALRNPRKANVLSGQNNHASDL